MFYAGDYFHVLSQNLPREQVIKLFDLFVNGTLVIAEEPSLKTEDGLTHCYFPKMTGLNKSERTILKMNAVKTFKIDIKPSVYRSIYRCFFTSIILHESIHVLNLLDPQLGKRCL